jgi:hypothetical protein
LDNDFLTSEGKPPSHANLLQRSWYPVRDISATTGHSVAVMRAAYSHAMPKKRRGGTNAIAAALAEGE